MKPRFLYTILMAAGSLLLLTGIWLSIPMKSLDKPSASVLYDAGNKLLAAQIASDGQWRLPQGENDSIPEKYKICLLTFEDKRFMKHRGIDILAMGRAVLQNVSEGSIVSGGSTISMQVMRMLRDADKRNIKNKSIEILLAQKLEFRHSKDEILKMYAGNAPFGGNTVGLKAAAWRYFGRQPSDLTWAESALLAVLPNAPASIHLNKNRQQLKQKRNRLLTRLYNKDIIDKETWQLAMAEEIPDALQAFPNKNIHLLHKLKRLHPDRHIFHTHINSAYQERCMEITNRHYRSFRKNGIHNMAAIIAETKSGEVLAYIGNTGLYEGKGKNGFVDMPSARRSTGSILKPFLYAHMLSKGEITPNSLVPDYPVQFGSYEPENFMLGHDGAVPASRCIVRSLNVPAVHLLKQHGVPVFAEDLRQMRISSVDRSAGDYGLSLILGGAEGRLDELCAAYASMGRRLMHYQEYNARYKSEDIRPLTYLKGAPVTLTPFYQSRARLDAAGIWYTFEAMKDVKRPDGKGNWRHFNSEQAIAWKTGTSYGFRDAWAIGVTPEFTVAVWVGNADGEGRPGLVGLQTAAPVLFDIFDFLPAYSQWFKKPFDAMIKMPVCRKSGYLAGNVCPDTDSVWLPEAAYHYPQCPWHRLIHLDETGTKQVSAQCYPIDKMQHQAVFVLPPAMEWYYRKKHPEYHGTPPWHPDCNPEHSGNYMEIIYPDDFAEIYLPTDLDGIQQEVVFEAAHHDKNATIYWYVDDEYLASTKYHHQISLSPGPGKHHLILTDNLGKQKVHRFTVLNERQK